MRTHRLFGLAVVAGLSLAACGQKAAGPSVSKAPAPPASTQAAAQPAPDAAVSVKASDSPLGRVLVSPDGHTLYGLTNDVNATPTCFGTCAQAWPPVIVDPNWSIAPGLDSGAFSTIIRQDGRRQLVAGKWPLYQYSGDAKPGDVNGEGSGDVWFAVGPDTRLLHGAASSNGAATQTPATAPAAPGGAGAAVTTARTSLGDVLVDSSGHTLYGLTKDANGAPTCVAACATAWPPALVNSTSLPAGLDPKLFSVVARPDGKLQLKAGKWPLYRFAGDDKAGDVNGQGTGGVWFAVAPDATLRRSANADVPTAAGAQPATTIPGY